MRRLDDTNPRSLRYRRRRARFLRIEAILRRILRDRPVARVIDIGGRPAYWRLLDPELHDRVQVTLLNLPEPVRVGLHQRLNVGFARRTGWEDALARVDHTRMISRAMLRRLFPDARHTTERFALLPKSLIAWRDWPGAGAGA